MFNRKSLIFFIGVFAVLLFLEWPGSWLFEPDEARYAQIPQAMLISGDYLTPTLNGTIYYEKPPLLYWLGSASMKVFGETPFAARLPVRLAALGTALALLFMMKGGSPAAGCWSALVYLSSLVPFALGRINITDGLVSFGLCLTLLSIRSFLMAENNHHPGKGALVGIGIGAGIAVLSKGLIGLVFPAMILVLWSLVMGSWTSIFRIVFSRTTLIFLLMTAPWFVLMERAHPDFSEFFFMREHFLRYTTQYHHRPGHVTYFVPVFLLGFMPWTLFFFKSLKPLLTLKLSVLREHPDELFFGVWFFTIFLFFSVSSSKLIPYLLPAFPAAAALAGLLLSREEQAVDRTLLWTAVFWSASAVAALVVGSLSGTFERDSLRVGSSILAAFTVGGVWVAVFFARAGKSGISKMLAGWAVGYLALTSVVPALAVDHSLHDMAVKAFQVKADYVVAYKWLPHSFPLINRKPVPIVGFRGELASDDVLPPDIFWSTTKFWSVWNSDEKIVAVFHKEQLHQFERRAKKPFVLFRNRKFILASNFVP